MGLKKQERKKNKLYLCKWEKISKKTCTTGFFKVGLRTCPEIHIYLSGYKFYTFLPIFSVVFHILTFLPIFSVCFLHMSGYIWTSGIPI